MQNKDAKLHNEVRDKESEARDRAKLDSWHMHLHACTAGRENRQVRQ